jgi:hypothetical protein
MARTKQSLAKRSKPHKKQVLKLRARKNKEKGKRRSALTKRKSGGKKK